jgi:hypothetical protein
MDCVRAHVPATYGELVGFFGNRGHLSSVYCGVPG